MEQLIIFLVLITLGYLFGRTAEKRHFNSIFKREEELADILTFAKRYPNSVTDKSASTLVAGNVVISIDYFKRIASGLRSIVGGRVQAYETLVERARREALLRMKQEARDLGAHTIINVKLETSSISKGNNQQIGSVEVLAYGTALYN